MALTVMPRIEMIDLATLTLPEWHPEAAADPICRVYGYVIDHPDGAIVFDTGVGVGNEFVDEVYRPDVRLLEAELLARGFGLDAVIAVVNSHLHFDHCGQNQLFHGSGVPMFVQRSEVVEVERDPHYTDAASALTPVDQRRTLDGDLEIAEGVTIFSTPGHTAGHQSLVVEAGAGVSAERIVIAGQAVWNATEYVDEIVTTANVGSDALRPSAVDSIRRIKALRPRTVFFSHCTQVHTRPDGER